MKFIVPILVGAAIGYTTNWIAIKMLFRPYYEKRFLGVHIPFTPGLIPKERGRIARSIGETVGSYLLTPEVVMKSLSHGRLDDYIRIWVESNMDRFKKEKRSIGDFIIKSEKEGYERFLKTIKERVAEFICSQLGKEESKQRIIDLVESHILHSSSENILKSINQNMELFLYQLVESDNMKFELTNALETGIENLEREDRRLEEVLPHDFILIIKESIQNQNKTIVSIIKEMLENPSMELKIKGMIASLVSQNMSKVITMFLSPDIISDKVFNGIKEHIDKPEISESIALILVTMTDKVLEYKVGDLTTGISSKLQGDEIIKVSDSILSHISTEENMDRILHIVEERINSSQPEIEKKALELISNEIEILFASGKLDHGIDLILDQMVESILDRPIASILANIDDATIENMIELCKTIFDDFVKNRLPGIVELFNISKIVEDQINSFDVEFAEEIILQIAHKELKAITWLGALLGGIMGILSPLLQRI